MKPNDGCLVQPKHVAFWITIIKRCARTVCLIVTSIISRPWASVEEGMQDICPSPGVWKTRLKNLTITKFNVIKTTTQEKLLAVPVPSLHPQNHSCDHVLDYQARRLWTETSGLALGSQALTPSGYGRTFILHWPLKSTDIVMVWFSIKGILRLALITIFRNPLKQKSRLETYCSTMKKLLTVGALQLSEATWLAPICKWGHQYFEW